MVPSRSDCGPCGLLLATDRTGGTSGSGRLQWLFGSWVLGRRTLRHQSPIRPQPCSSRDTLDALLNRRTADDGRVGALQPEGRRIISSARFRLQRAEVGFVGLGVQRPLATKAHSRRRTTARFDRGSPHRALCGARNGSAKAARRCSGPMRQWRRSCMCWADRPRPSHPRRSLPDPIFIPM